MRASSSSQLTPEPWSASADLKEILKHIAGITEDNLKDAEPWRRGGFGEVYVLTHAAIGRLALKRVRTFGSQQEVKDQTRRSIREAETWRKLSDHPNILPFFDVLERSEYIYLVSPFVQNGSIVEFIQQHPNVDRVRLIQEAGAGIAYLHRNGIVHGDIKGVNILISDDIHSLLCDFGLARPHLTNTSTAMKGVGTIRWQSPELINGGQKNFKSDAWAFAMTVYEVLSGKLPYHDCPLDSTVMLAVIILKRRPQKEPTTSPIGKSYAILWEVTEDCWNEDPDQRPEMEEAYDRLISGGSQSPPIALPPNDDKDISYGPQIISSLKLSLSPSPSSASSITNQSLHQSAKDHWERGVGTVLYHPTPETEQRMASTNGAAGPGGGPGGASKRAPYGSGPWDRRPTDGADHHPAPEGRHPSVVAAVNGPATGMRSPSPPNNPNLRTQKISMPSDMVGCIIGKSGAKITEIRRLSGCKISIAKTPHDETGERMITIVGTPEANEKALFFLYNQLEMEKERRVGRGDVEEQ